MFLPQIFTDSHLLSSVFIKRLIVSHALYIAREGSLGS
jgi:hypothetical protein